MADRKSSNTTKKRTTTTGNSGRKTSRSGSRSSGARSGGRSSASRTSTSSRNYGRTSRYAAQKRRKEEHDEMRRDILLVLLFAGMVFLFLSNCGLFGIVGHWCKTVMFGAVGAAAYILPIVVFALILYGSMSGDDDAAGARIGCVLVMYLVIAIVCDLMSGAVNEQSGLDMAGIISRCTENSNGGGVIGGLFAWIFMHFLGLVGTVLFLIVVAVICLVVITGKPLLRLMQDQAADARDRARYRREAEAAYRAEHPEEYEGFLPDEEDDELTDDDIAAYHARQEELARQRRQEREERLRGEARRDVERRHEQRNQVYQTFRGIVGDTNLSNDPYVRQMTEAAAAGNDMMQHADPTDSHAAMEDTAYIDNVEIEQEVLQDGGQASTAPSEDDRDPESLYPQEDIQEADAAASIAETGADMDEETAADRIDESSTANVRGWWPIHASARQESERETVTSADVISENETQDPPEVAPGAFAAQQLLKNQIPGTDGIQLTVAAATTVENLYEDDEQSADPGVVRDAVRQAIPIHRESSNLHEINALEFQGSYAALARNTIQTDEDDEDLTSRIIREGMADLERKEQPEQIYGSARSAALDAFSRSHAFTEIQQAYRRPDDIPEGFPAEELEETRSDTGSETVTGAQMEQSAVDVSSHAENDPDADIMDSAMQTSDIPSVPVEPVHEWDGEDVYASDAPYDVSQDEESVAPATELSGDDAPVTDISLATAATAPVDEMTAVTSIQTAAETAAAITAPTQMTAPGPAMATMPEMTTPVGTGSPIAAQHAQDAQIHTENTAAVPAALVENPADTAQPTQTAPAQKRREYVYPPLRLLGSGNPSQDSGSDEELRHTAEILETTLHTFHVNCKITDISQGPAVTRYELLPEQGVKVSKVVGLSDDIKLALAATDIRIEAPIPGKSAIGIEVPNKMTSMVALRDILSHPNFRDHKSRLAIGVGKDISGQIVVSDLAKMPHVLIAGATGSGKSVCINTIIMSILYHASPEEVKLLMIDPKVVELSVYNGIPHLLYPVVTNPQQAATLLNWAVAEMEARYRKFADARVRDMKGYNQMIQQQLDQGVTTDAEGNTLRVMPRIVVIVDELADLMMVAKNDVETAICRLAQLARAAGIHLIIATQRPSVDVITGLIKANMPSRIAFAVSSGVDSRTILDMNGAEKLLGKGDMLFFPQGLPKPARIQGAFVTDDEVSDVVTFIKDQNPADTEEESIMRQQMDNLSNTGQVGSTDSKAQDGGNDIDDYFRRAGRFIIEKDNASIGLLQRGFRIGFNRAARLMDQLCDAGVVAESEGTKSRRILMTEAEFEAYCQENDIR